MSKVKGEQLDLHFESTTAPAPLTSTETSTVGRTLTPSAQVVHFPLRQPAHRNHKLDNELLRRVLNRVKMF